MSNLRLIAHHPFNCLVARANICASRGGCVRGGRHVCCVCVCVCVCVVAAICVCDLHLCGGDMWHTRAQGRWTALIYAAAEGHADCVRLLLDAGADKDAKDQVRASGRVVWRWACCC